MINITSGIKYEFERFFVTTNCLFNNYYKKANFIVLPYLVKGAKNVVRFPENISKDLVYRFKEYTSNYTMHEITANLGNIMQTDLFKDFMSLGITDVSQEKINSIKKDLEFAYPLALGFLTDTLPFIQPLRFNTDVMLVKYGTLVSFNLEAKRNYQKVKIYLREDMGTTEFIEGLTSALLLDYFNKNNYSWIQREKVIDFLLTQTKLAKLVKGYSPTISNFDPKHDKSIAKLYIDSVTFLEKIGYSFDEDLNIVDGHVFINGKKSDIEFTKSEKKLLNLLLHNRDRVVSYFMIGDILWDDPDKFSLWAISRLVYKIKYKLKKAGFPVSKLQNVRGEGYQLDK